MAPERLGDSPTTDLGAPIVDSRNMVVSGNGRILAIRQAYDTGNADAYRKYVQKRARSMGLEIPANVKNPVLVRRVDNTGEMSMEEFAAKSNKSDLAGMSNAENAIADARRILDAHLLDRFFPSDNGDVLAASNNDFITEFLDIVGGREQYIDKNGARKPNLAPRIKAAVLAAMLNPEKRDIIENLLDNPQGWSGLINGLFGSVANLAKLDGNADYNLADELSKAVEIFVGLQRAGESVATFNAQGDMFNEPISDEVGFLIELFEKNTRTPTGISGVLNAYYNLVKNIDTTTQDMFGAENPSKIDELRAAYQKYSTSLTEEPNVSWRDTSEPTDAEIQEARRQKDEVKAKWTKPDGTMKKGYRLAPNGKESRLSEEQWLLVRMPNFKKWFGDWEALAEAYPENEIFDIDEAYKFARKNLQGGSFTSKDGYGATLGREGIDKMNSGLARGKTANNRLHALAFANIGKLFGNSELLETEPPRDGNTNIKQYLKFYAPLYMDGLYAVKITVKELSGNNGNRLYSIEGLDITKESEYRGQSRGSKENSIPADYSDSVNNFVKKLREVKGNVSQVVDENGEPLVVYHGTDWKPLAEKAGEAVFKDESYFTASRLYANRYKNGGEVYSFFLNARKPFDTRNPKEREIFEKEFYGKWGNGAPLSERGLPDWTDGSDLFEFLQEKGYDYDSIVLDEGGDGGYGDSVSYRGESYVPLKPNQIKSTTDNVGTFSENPDIRWSIREDSDAEKINNQFRELYERYKNGDKSAYEEAAKLVADYAESKGYDVKVYHGTGADGFNVAKADASEAKNGEGAQAHGMGLYLATGKKTAEGYRDRAPMQERYTIGGKTFEELGLTREKLNHSVVGLVKFLHSLGVEEGKKTINARIEKQTKRLESAETHLQQADDEFVKELAQQTIDNAKKEIASDRKTLNTIDKILSILEENGLSISDYEYTFNKGKVFDWRTNLKPENVLDEEKSLSEQPEIWEKLKKIWETIVYPEIEKGLENDDSAAAYAQHCAPTKWITGEAIVFGWGNFLGKTRFNKLMLDHGIKGITYDGQIDGRCYVSFEGGSAVKLQDPFTFDDNGQLIPLSKRFDETNPDMRWRDVEETPNLFERLKGVQGESTTEEKLKESGDLKYYFDYFKKNLLGKEIQTPIGKFAHFNLGHFNKLIARGENKGESGEVSSLKEWTDKIEHHGVDLGKNPPKGFDYARACNMPLVVDVLQNPQFVLVDTDDTLLFVKKYGEKTYFWCSVMNNGETLGIKSWRPLRLTKRKCEQLKVVYTKENGVVNLAQPRESQLNLDSTNLSENQEKNSRLRFLLRQERTENPVIWASIVLAKEILSGRGITRAKVEKLLPTEQFDGSKQNYAVERAQRIAEKTKATQKEFAKDLDVAIRKAESNLYWQDEFVENAYRAFSKGGEEYGFAKQRLMQYLKDLRNKELNKVKGYETEDFDVDLVEAILKAQEAEPERAAGDESKSAGEETEEELEESGGAFEGDEEFSGKKTPLAPSKIRDVIGVIRREVVKRVRDSDGDQKTLDEKYRKTLVNVLTDAMKELVYGKERKT